MTNLLTESKMSPTLLRRLTRILLAAALPAAVVVVPWYLSDDVPWWVLVTVEVVLVGLGLRQLAGYTARGLAGALPKAKQRQPSRDVSPRELTLFGQQITDATGQLSPGQISLFAASILYPAALRRRVTDRYAPGRRVLERQVLMEFDLDHALGPEARSDIGHAAAVNEKKLKYVAVLLPRKGHLHDNSKLVDGQGCLLSALSYKEYRILAGLTLRSLLTSAFKDRSVPPEVWSVELEYLQLLLQYGIVQSGDLTTDKRIEDVVTKLSGFKALVSAEGMPYIEALTSMVRTVATSYAVVAVLPEATPNRFSITYESTEIPGLEHPKRSVRANLQMLLGARPVTLRVSAANAATCQSYHLLVSATEDLYVGDFSAPFLKEDGDSQVPTDSRVSYHRLRGRRGQHYLHLYSRMGEAIELDSLKLDVEFYEVPPGSIARAAISAVVNLVICTAVAGAGVKSVSVVDGDIAAFLLAVPGIAAVWLGFEARQSRLLEGTLTARLSLMGTFSMSLAASLLLLFQKAGLLTYGAAGDMRRPHYLWLAIIAVSSVNAAVTSAAYWERSRYYKAIVTRPSEESSVILAR